MTFPHKPLLPIIFFFLCGCVYFNTFYNAETYFADALKLIEDSAMEKEDEIPSKAKNLLEKAINKCNIVIDEFPDSKYVDDAYFIIGKSGFLRSEFTIAEKHFSFIINEFPESEFYKESRIWLAYTQFKTGEVDTALIQFKNMETEKNSRDNRYLIFNALGDIHIEMDSVQTAFDYFDNAIEMARDSGQRIAVFNKIIRIAEKVQKYEIAVHYLEELEKQTNSPELRKSARLKWIDFNKILGEYDIILQEIDVLLGTAEYESMYLDLEMEKARIYMDRGDYSEGRTVLLTFIEQNIEKKDNKSKKARAEAYFILGESSLFNQFEFSAAREYFDKMSEEYNRSEFRTRTDKYLDLMDEYDEMKKQYIESVKKLEEEPKQESDSARVDLANSETDSTQTVDSLKIAEDEMNEIIEMEKGELDKGKDGESVKTAVVVPDSVLFAMCEMLVFDFGRKDSAVNRYQELVNKFPESNRMFKALYALSVFSEDSLNWRTELETRFPNYDEIDNEDEEIVITDSLESLRRTALDLIEIDPVGARDSIKYIGQFYNDALSIYFTAYISDNYLQDLEESKYYYKTYIDSFPNHEFHAKAKTRLDMIEQAIRDTLPPTEDTLGSPSELVDSLMNSNMPDSLKDSVDVPVNPTNFDSLWKNLQNRERMQFPGFNFSGSDSIMKFDSTMMKNFQNMRMKVED